jgi:dephospho-CoA kinase
MTESRRPLLVGLTGGLASGKSTVAGWLADAGFRVVDADRLVAELYQPGGTGARAVRELFGEEMLDARGGVDHAKLGARVFSDPVTRKSLEGVIHPLVRRRFEEIAATDSKDVVVLEATLLVEAGYGPSFDLIVTVEADAVTRLRRAVARGMDEAAARARLLAQGDGEARRAASHRVIDNCCDVPYLRHQVDELIVELRRLAEQRADQRSDQRSGQP